MSQRKQLTKPQWLPEEQLNPWMELVTLITLMPAHLDAQLTRDSGITHYEFMVMSMLSEAPERTLRMSELATRTNASLSRLSHVAKKLQERGWLEKLPCPEDARATNAKLTRDGFSVWLASAPNHLNEVRNKIIDALTPAQLLQLQQIASAINQRLDPQHLVELRKPSK